MQETDFPYELVIGEDCSVDGTRDIVVDYQRRHPDKIRLPLSPQNLGMRGNARRTREACRGKYLAILEGDDYWTSPSKLQKQADFLDSHPECAVSFHPALVVYEDAQREPVVFPQKRKPMYRLEDLMECNFVPTCSTMYRARLPGDVPDWFYTMPVGDWPFLVLLAQHGDIGCIDEVMGAYRKHASGVTATRSTTKRLLDYADFYAQMTTLFGRRFERTIRRSMARQWEIAVDDIAQVAFGQGTVEAAQAKLDQVFAEWPDRLSPPTEAWKARVLGRTYALFAFAGYEVDDLKSVRHCLPRAVRRDPVLLRNLGMWSIGMEAFLGRRVAAWLRWLARAGRPAKARLIDVAS
jgi:glycosyltransferase involved in cell wall biosynthesis